MLALSQSKSPKCTLPQAAFALVVDRDIAPANTNESIKISVRFLTNEIRSDALNINVFTKRCSDILNCKIYETNDVIVTELTKEILKLATKYEKSKQDKAKEKNKNYKYPDLD